MIFYLLWGLYIIIFGEIGIGKLMFVECMYYFVIEFEMFLVDVLFVFFNCVDYV